MDNLAQAIDDHSHYEDDSDKFWESLYEQYGAEYLKDSGKPSFSDFQVWADDKGLVPELQDE